MTILFSLCTFIYCIGAVLIFFCFGALGAGELKLTANNLVTSLDGAFGAFKTVESCGGSVNSVKRKSTKSFRNKSKTNSVNILSFIDY